MTATASRASLIALFFAPALFVVGGCGALPEPCEGLEIPPDTNSPCGPELCDGVDNDCDGVIDNGFPDPDGDGVPNCEAAEEICDGLDNNGDGRIDEGFDDRDNDGIGDCVDGDCEVDSSPGGPLSGTPTCGGGPITRDADFWNPEVRVMFDRTYDPFDPSSFTLEQLAPSHTAPLAAALYDTNSDGAVTVEDKPYTFFTGHLVISSPSIPDLFLFMSLDETPEDNYEYDVDNRYDYGGNAVADVDGDGSLETITIARTIQYVDGVPTPFFHVQVNQATGLDEPPNSMETQAAVLWPTDDELKALTEKGFLEITNGTLVQPIVADLDGNGTAEIIAHNLVLDALTGETLATLSWTAGIDVSIPTVGDIDLDGFQEIVMGDTVFAYDGTPLWDTDGAIEASRGQFSAIVQGDTDPEGEVAMIGNGRYSLFDTDGTPLAARNFGGTVMGPPCVADFDGDGDPEMSFTAGSLLYNIELDGTVNWTASVADSNGFAACSAFDFDNDQAYEVIYADTETLWVFDGETGAVNYENANHASGTQFEYPIVADVTGPDGTGPDGSADILLVSSNLDNGSDWAGLRAFSHPNKLWAPGGPFWQSHDYASTNINPDSTLPLPEDAHYWTDSELYRGRPGLPPKPDVLVEILDLCESGCEDFSVVRLSVQVSNTGTQGVAAGMITLDLYAVNGAGDRTLLTSDVYPYEVGDMEAGPSTELAFTYGDYLSAAGVTLVVVASVDSSYDECDTTNNEADWPWLLCDGS